MVRVAGPGPDRPMLAKSVLLAPRLESKLKLLKLLIPAVIVESEKEYVLAPKAPPLPPTKLILLIKIDPVVNCDEEYACW